MRTGCLVAVTFLICEMSIAQIIVPPGYGVDTFYTGISNPDGIAWKNTDTLLVINEGNPLGVFIARRGDTFDSTDAFSTIGSPFVSPDDIYLHSNGEVFVVDGSAAAVFKIPASGGTPTVLAPISNPFGITLAPPSFNGPNVDPGDLIVADNAFAGPGKAVWSVNPSTGNARIIAQGNVFVDGPLQVEFSPSDVLYVYQNFDSGTSRIVTLSAAGVVAPFISGIPDRGGLAINPISCYVYYGLRESARQILRVPCTGGTPELFASGFNPYMQDMRFSPDGTRLYVSMPNYVLEIVGPFTTAGDESPLAPPQFVLEQNYPNPFNPSTTIRVSLPRSNHVTLKIYNLLGQELETLLDKKLSAGEHEVKWSPSRYPGGVYLYRVQMGNFTAMRKLILLK